MTVLNIETQLGINKKDQIFEGPARIIDTEGFEFDQNNDLFKSPQYAQSLYNYYKEDNSIIPRTYYLSDVSSKGNIVWSNYENAWQIFNSENKYSNNNETNTFYSLTDSNGVVYNTHENYESPITEYNNNTIQGETYRLSYYQDADGYHDICITYNLVKDTIDEVRKGFYFKYNHAIQIRDKEQNNKLICSLSMNDTNKGIPLCASNNYWLSIDSNNYIYVNKITLTNNIPSIESKRIYDTVTIDTAFNHICGMALSFNLDKIGVVLRQNITTTAIAYLTGLTTSLSGCSVTGFTTAYQINYASCCYDPTNTYLLTLHSEFTSGSQYIKLWLLQHGTSNGRFSSVTTSNNGNKAYFPTFQVQDSFSTNAYKYCVVPIINTSSNSYTHSSIFKVIFVGDINNDAVFQKDTKYAVPGYPICRPYLKVEPYGSATRDYLYFTTTPADAITTLKETCIYKYCAGTSNSVGNVPSQKVSYIGRINVDSGIVLKASGNDRNYLLSDIIVSKYSKDININSTVLDSLVSVISGILRKSPKFIPAYSLLKNINDFDINSYIINGSNPLMISDGKVYNPISFAPSLTIADKVTASGGPGAGTYSYIAVIETDTPWGTIQTFPSIPPPISVTLASGEYASITIQNLNLHTSYANHYMAVYRTTNGGSVYRLVGRVRLQSIYSYVDNGYGFNYTKSLTAFDDNQSMTDYYLLQNKILYTTGSGSSLDGRMANYGIPAHTVLKECKERWIACGLEKRNTVQFSLLKQPNEPVQFAHPSETSLLIEMPSEAISVNFIDDTYLVFCKDGVYSIYGQGPDDTGSNGYFDYPQRISTIGTSNKKTCDCNIGIVYQGKDNKLYLVQKGSGNQVIPLSTMLQNDLGIVADFYYDVNRNQLKVLEQDTNKIYTYSFEKNVWTATTIDFSMFTGYFKCMKFVDPIEDTDQPRILVRQSQYEDFSIAGFSTFVMYQSDVDTVYGTTIKEKIYTYTTNRFCPAVVGNQMGPSHNSPIGTYGEVSSIKLNILKKNANIQTTNRQVKLTVNYFDGDIEKTETKTFNLRADVSTYNNYEELVYKPAFKKIKNMQLVVEFLFNDVSGYDANLIGITVEGVSQGTPNRASADQRG